MSTFWLCEFLYRSQRRLLRPLKQQSSEWIQREVEIYELDQAEVETSIERMRVIHGDELVTVIETSRNPGRSSRHSRANPQTLAKAKALVTPPLKRKASGEAEQNQGPVKRAKVHSKSTASASSTPHTPSDATRQSPPTTILSTLDWMSTLDTTENDAEETGYKGAFTDVVSPDSTQSESEDEDGEDPTELDWESVSRRRYNAMVQKRKQTSLRFPAISKPVFADRSFWQTTWS
jgi:hypothetical protein